MKKFIKKKKLRVTLYVTVVVIVAGFLMLLLPFRNPVVGANVSDYHPQSFWYYPWGSSVTHKGVDIFGKKGTPVQTAYPVELVLFAGNIPGSKEGNCVVTLAPGWRLHCYAHLNEVTTHLFALGGRIGTVGNTGNAAKTPSHLHFGCATIYPRFGAIDTTPHGFLKCFFINPIPQLNKASS
ncbi:MAG: M23 family metallopeptidase [Muribaculaceae bacterium]|nr:M23 family metallopeptidase [Muribaculaceae bacterium]MDE6803812.1 M23 family metallopeptidase [Muribaculaceae bacterium]